MKTFLHAKYLHITLLIFFQPFCIFAQNLSLGTCVNYVFFTETGAVTNTGTSSITGNIGTGAGEITGCGPATEGNSRDIANDATTQASNDLHTVYNTLIAMPATQPQHAVIFGSPSGETIPAGVYALGGATSVNGNLTLDASNDPNARFIFLINGEFSTTANTIVTLINGSSPNNVFWVAKGGAINMATNTKIVGTFISQGGAASMASSAHIDGRLLVYIGAVNFGSGYARGTAIYPVLPVNLISFTAVCKQELIELKWKTASEANNDFFIIEKSMDGIKWQNIAIVQGAGTSSIMKKYLYNDSSSIADINYYRLKQTDHDQNFKYGPTVMVKKCSEEESDNLIIYPNPSHGKINLQFINTTQQPFKTELLNVANQVIYTSTGLNKTIDMSHNLPGIYYVRVYLNDKILTTKIIRSNNL